MSSQLLTAGTVLRPAPSSRTVSASHRPISVCAAHTDSRNMEFILLITAVSVRLVLHDNRAHTGSAGPGRAQPADLWTLRPLKKGLQSRNKAHTVPVWMFLWGSTPTGWHHPHTLRQRGRKLVSASPRQGSQPAGRDTVMGRKTNQTGQKIRGRVSCLFGHEGSC